MTFREKLIEFLLRRRNLYFYGPPENLMQEVEKHHPYVAKEAREIADWVEKQLEHDELFKEVPPGT